MALTPERASELGKLSAERRRERPAFPALDNPANAKVRLAYISNLELGGKITSASANSQERITRTWLEVYLAEIDMKRLKQLEQRVRELEDELEQARRGAGVRRAS